jgi:hypothetical protein
MFYGADGGDTFFGWRCIHCGEIIDKVILENRTKGGRKYETHSSNETGSRFIKEG